MQELFFLVIGSRSIRRTVHSNDLVKFFGGLRCTVPDRSNLTGNALLERKWNAKWNAAGTLRERQRNAKISVELERGLNKNAFY